MVSYKLNYFIFFFFSFRYDDEKDKYYLINNETGQSVQVHKTGDFIKEFDASLTGTVDYNQRVLKAQNVYK